MIPICCTRRFPKIMGNDELDVTQLRRRGRVIDVENDSKSPKSPPVAQLDENRNKKQPNSNGVDGTHRKSTRFSFDKVDIPIGSANQSPSSPLPRRGGRSTDEHSTPKKQPWLTRKSADWGHGTSGRNNGAAGRRRTEVMVVLMGSSRVGKSAIVNQFLHNMFRQEYTATVDELHWIEYDATNSTGPQEQKEANDHNASNSILLLKIMDTSGSHEFIGMRKLYEQQGDAFILVISVEDPASFEEAKVIRQEIAERNTKRAPVICVLNKIDSEQGLNSKVKPEQVRDYALSNHCLFVEVTATEHDSVAEIFRRLLQQNSIVPSAAHLKYRRKSVPISSVAEFGDEVAMKKSIGSAGKKYLKAINECNGAEDEKRPACVIC